MKNVLIISGSPRIKGILKDYVKNLKKELRIKETLWN